jgi:hypothetical protein
MLASSFGRYSQNVVALLFLMAAKSAAIGFGSCGPLKIAVYRTCGSMNRIAAEWSIR